MARRAQRAPGKADSAEAGLPARRMPEAGAASAHLVVIPGRRRGPFGFRLEAVSEIIRVPPLAHMPLAPRSLLGLANLRGVVLPVVEPAPAAGPAGCADRRRDTRDRDRPRRAASASPSIGSTLSSSVAADELSDDARAPGRLDPDILDGVIKGAEGDDTIKILESGTDAAREFADRRRVGRPRWQPPPRSRLLRRPPAARPKRDRSRSSASNSARRNMRCRSSACARSFRCPSTVAEMPRSETAVLGVVTLRGRLLPLVSLRALLGLPQRQSAAVAARSLWCRWAMAASASWPTAPARSCASIPV